jgi:hypothetical protein
MKFLKISITLTKNGYNTIRTVWDVKETNLLYKLTKDDNDGYRPTARHVRKEDLMKVDTIYNPSTTIVEYRITCPIEKEEEAKLILMDKIKIRVLEMKKQIDELLIHI